MWSNVCFDGDVQKTLCRITNQTKICLLSIPFRKPRDNWLCLHVILFLTTLCFHESKARTELWHMHKSSVDLNSPSSTLYDFLSRNRMTESHTKCDRAVALPLRRDRSATISDSHSAGLCLIYRPAAEALRRPVSTECSSTRSPYPTCWESIHVLLKYPALNLQSFMHAHSR